MDRLDQLKDIFVKENPFELNLKMEKVQEQKADVILQQIKLNEIIADNRKKLHGYLRANYLEAINSTKKNAGMDALELWAGASGDIGDGYESYIWAKEKYNFLDKVRVSLESDISALQSRARIFQETK